ncbi:MAG: sulfurtransferase complex subunit TusB [Promethearchaeota archaeon]
MVENNNLIVYLFGFSLRKNDQSANLISIISDQINAGARIKIVLMHDGVIGISKLGKVPSSLKKLLNLPIEIYAIIPDIKARGIDIKAINEKIVLIEYENLVDILVETSQIVSWL